MPRNPKSKRAAAAKPVRAWVCCFKCEGPLEAVRSEFSVVKVYRKPLRWGNEDYHSRPVGMYDPRTHRAVAIKKARGK